MTNIHVPLKCMYSLNNPKQQCIAGARGRLFIGFISFCLFGPDGHKSARSHLLSVSDDDGNGGRAKQRKKQREARNKERANDADRGMSAEELKDRAELAQRDEAMSAKDQDRKLLALHTKSKSLQSSMSSELQLMALLPDQSGKDECLKKYRALDAENSDVLKKITGILETKRKVPDAVAEYLSYKTTNKKPKPGQEGGSGSGGSGDEGEGPGSGSEAPMS